MPTDHSSLARRLEEWNASISKAIQMGLHEHAVEVARKALPYAAEQAGEGSPAHAVQLQVLAQALLQSGELAEVETHLLAALEIRRKALGEDHPAYASVLFLLGQMRAFEGNLAAAAELFEKVLAIRRRRLGENHEFTKQVHNALESIGQKNQGERPDSEALDLYRRAIKAAHEGDFDGAVSLFQCAVRRNRTALGEKHPDVARCLQALGDLYVQIGRPDDAIDVASEALEICRTSQLPVPEFQGMVLGVLARAHERTGDKGKARALHKESLQQLELAGESAIGMLITSLANQATFEHRGGHLAEGELLMRRALAIIDSHKGRPLDELRARVMNGLAVIAQDKGDMDEAISLMEASVEIKKELLGENDISYALGADNLAAMYGTVGDETKAQMWNQRAVAVLDRMGIKEHPQRQKFRFTAAKTAKVRGDREQAREAFAKIINHPLSDRDLVARATLELESLNDEEAGDESQSIASKRKMVSRVGALLGEQHPQFAQALSQFAEALLAGDREEERQEGLRHLRTACDLLRKTNAETPFIRILLLHRLIDAELRANCCGDLLALLREIVSLENLTFTNVVFSTGRLGSLFAAMGGRTLSILLSNFIGEKSAAMEMAEVLDCTLQRKGHLFEAARVVRLSIVEAAYPSLREKLVQIAAKNRALSETLFDGPVTSAADFSSDVVKVADEIAQLSAEALKELPADVAPQLWSSLSHSAAVRQLQPGDLLMEIVKFNRRDLASGQPAGEHYIAFLTKAGAAQTHWHLLGSAKEMDENIEHWRGELSQPTSASLGKHDALNSPLSLAWRKWIAPACTGATRIFVCPDGKFWRFPFEVLPLADGSWLGERSDVIYLNSPLDLLPAGVEAQEQPIVICDPDFDLPMAGENASPRLKVTAENLEKYPGLGMTITYQETPKDSKDLGFEHLTHTQREGTQVAEILDARLISKELATKSAMYDLHSPAVLHLATHGFLFEDVQALDSFWAQRAQSGRVLEFGTLHALMDFMMERTRYHVGKVAAAELIKEPGQVDDAPAGGIDERVHEYLEDPLLRCGLVLGGANNWLRKEPTSASAGNGLLSAFEVAQLDLAGTSLVVLSGCNTGSSQGETTRGVEGLRRAFLLAGARSVVATLWPIPDRESSELMIEFYRCLAEGQPKSVALREAKLWMKTRHKEPYYWAAFVLQGDPGPLPAFEKIPTDYGRRTSHHRS